MRILVMVCILVAIGAMAGLAVVHVRAERCVQATLKAHQVGLSTWEAIALCNREAGR